MNNIETGKIDARQSEGIPERIRGSRQTRAGNVSTAYAHSP
jgi:hypothetical protein